MAVFSFAFGLIIGSFLNVLVLRLPQGESLLGFSRCRNCKKEISWFDNIPLVSFLILGGRCRSCRARLSFQYPIVELSCGLIFFFSFTAWAGNPSLWAYVAFLSVLSLAIGLIDLRKFIILDELLITGLIGTILFFVFGFTDCRVLSCSISSSAWGVAFFAGIYLVIYLVSRGKWIGFGDIKFASFLGFALGFENSVNVFMLTFIFGFVLAIILLSLKGAGLKTKVPLGAIMSLAVITFLLTGFNLPDLIGLELVIKSL